MSSNPSISARLARERLRSGCAKRTRMSGAGMMRSCPARSAASRRRGHTMRGLEDKVAIVTGGATLIGAAVVRAFAEAGTEVVVADIDATHGQAVAGAIGPRARFVATDLRRDEDIAALVSQTVATFGGIDVLVNAAAVYLDR